jgi:cobalamin biosynthesis Mg chelatase CobN
LVKAVVAKLDLTLHPEKTRLVSMWDGKEGFDFLGLHHRRLKAETGKGRQYSTTHQIPSRKATKKMRETVKRELASRAMLCQDIKTLIDNLNPKIRGWRNHYGVATAGKWLQKIDWYILLRFTIWWNKKHRKKRTSSGAGKVRKMIYDCGLQTLAA